jgi:hypothetical protein
VVSHSKLNNMKDKRYKRMKKAILAGASSGIVAGMILMGSGNTAYAETSELSVPAYTQSSAPNGMHMMHKWNSVGKAGAIAGGFGLDKDVVRAELKSGKTMKQILQENGIVIKGDRKSGNRMGVKGWRKNI